MKVSQLLRSIAVGSILALGAVLPASASITAFFSAGTTCGGAASANYTQPGPAVKVSLCVTTTVAVTEQLCGHTTYLSSASAAQDGRFNVTNRALGAFTDNPFNATLTTIVPVTFNTSGNYDFGALSTGFPAFVASPATTLVETFDLTPQASANAASYVISTGPGSKLAVDTTGDCSAPVPATTAGATFTLNLFVAPAAPLFTSVPPPPGGTVNAVYGGYTFTASGNPAPTFAVTTGALPAGMSLAAGGALSGTPTAGGTFNFTVTASNGVAPAATQATSITIAPAAQTITFNNPGAQPFNASPFVSGATASSGLAVILTSTTPGVCTITPANSLNITMVSAGSCTVNANQPGNANFAVAPQVQQTFTINAVAPSAPTGVSGAAGFQQATITFTPVTGANTGGAPIAANGYAATCTGVPTLTVNGSASPITIGGLVNGNTYSCSVTATNTVPLTSGASSSVMVTPVNIAPPAFTTGNVVPAMTVGVAMPTFNIAASGGPSPTITQSGTLPGIVFTSGGPGSGTATLSGTPTLAGTFPITLTATSATAPPATQNITLTVAKANQTITFAGPGAQSFSATPVAISATATSTLAVTFSSTTLAVCSVAGTSVTMITVGTCTIAADQAGNANFNAAPQVLQSFLINQAAQTITFGAQPARGFSASPQAINPLATASSGLAVTYTSTTLAVCTVSGATFTSVALGTCTIAANQAGNANYSAAPQVTQSFAITLGTQTISFGGLSNQPLGTPPITVSPTASSGLPVTVTSTTPTVCTSTGVNGRTITLLILGTCTLQGTQAGNANFAAAPPVTSSFSVIPPGAVTLTTSMNPAIYRSPLLLTANISGTNPTGSVTFAILTSTGPVTLCAAVPLVSSIAACPVPAQLNVTNLTTYTATYSGDTNNPGNASSIVQLVNTSSVTLNVVTTPIQPIVGATVVLRATVAGVNLSNKVQFNENGTALPGCGAVTVALLPGANDIGVASCTITGITTGLHNYVVTYLHVTDAGFEQVVVPITPLVGAASDFTDMWWVGLSENGWGLSITQHGQIQFIVLYVYDSSGNPIWYVLPNGTWNASNTAYTGALYQPTSSPFSNYVSNSFNPFGITGASVGTATVTYTGSGTATLTYTINGISGSKPIVRQPFATDDGQARLQVNDMWWAGIGENGWGMNIAQQGRVLFPIWYTYSSLGRTVFYTVPGGTWTGSSFTGDIYSTVSSVWLGVNYNPAQFVVTKVGTMTLDFSDQSNAVMTYTIGNVKQNKVIMRQPFP